MGWPCPRAVASAKLATVNLLPAHPRHCTSPLSHRAATPATATQPPRTSFYDLGVSGKSQMPPDSFPTATPSALEAAVDGLSYSLFSIAAVAKGRSRRLILSKIRLRLLTRGFDRFFSCG
ncbi:hypothetical protein LR48_Vigan10g131100 [Vigna angularis]|uniref:Uncharacterized protein n=1 Tax=Phaseolus angularis TaxID=3914 RepID=A0A0L9VL19_PHAAN|nr:hypothetical protein LR48_Vigan10g131100 [Vigna angularis]